MTTTATAETPTPAPKPEPATKAPATTVTLRHPGLDGCVGFGKYALQTEYTFDTATDQTIIHNLKQKGFIQI